MNAKKKVELLAPAGNKEGFYGTIHAGADAVYLGGSRFGARAYADNFTTEELLDCIRYAHIWGRKVYLTVNTLIKEAELSELYEYLAPLYEAGLDAVIVQDIGAFHYIKKHFPLLALHVSTQMTITGVHGARLLQDMGAVRIVPARELCLSEIMELKRQSGLEIECFIHGAMCYCYSGQCLFSSILGGRSGNRGRCAQPCRLPYTVQGANGRTKECYPLSLKDMCTIEHLPELIEAGIDSFKIEGRMKKPEYTAGVTAIYRKYIDKYYYTLEHGRAEGTDKADAAFKIDRQDMEALSSLYIRSKRQNGYYHKHNGRDMVTLTSPAYNKSDERLLAEIREKYLDKAPTIPIAMEAYFLCGQPARLTIALEPSKQLQKTLKYAAEGVVMTRTVTGAMVEPANNQPVTREAIEKQLRKLGGSCFSLTQLNIVSDENIFLPLKAINELRRAAVTAMEEALIKAHMPHGYADKSGESRDKDISKAALPAKSISKAALSDKSEAATAPDRNSLFLSLQTFEQLKGLYTGIKSASFQEIERIYISGDLFSENGEEQKRQALEICSLLSEQCELVIALPYILRASDAFYLEQLYTLTVENPSVFSGFLVRSMEGMGFLLAKGYQGGIYADAGLYLWNLESIACLQPYISGFCLPLELNEREQRNLLSSPVPCEKIIYGRIPMMITANCVAKTTDGCLKKNADSHILQLIDRYRKQFPVSINCTHCMNIIYNSVPLSLHGQLGEWSKKAALRLDFTVENSREMLDIITFFVKAKTAGKAAKLPALPYQDYTTGHEKRGVE